MVMTIRGLLLGKPTLTQLAILVKADQIGLPSGRYFQGQLSAEEIERLDVK